MGERRENIHMNSKGIVAIKDETICMKCLKNKANHTYYIK